MDDEPKLIQFLTRLDNSRLDLILVEGFRHEPIPKLEIAREHTRTRDWITDPSVIAIACDTSPSVPTDISRLDIDNIVEIADFIVHYHNMAKQKLSGTDQDSND